MGDTVFLKVRKVEWDKVKDNEILRQCTLNRMEFPSEREMLLFSWTYDTPHDAEMVKTQVAEVLKEHQVEHEELYTEDFCF